MSVEPELLERLAVLAGIATTYVDAWGETRTAPPATLDALLRAMGIATATAADAGRSLAAIEERSWHRLVEPVTVIEAGGSEPAVEVALGDDLADDATVDWRLELEAADELQGRAVARRLRLVAAVDLPGGRRVRRRLPLPPGLPLGYHRLTLAAGAAAGTALLIVAPARCYVPPVMDDDGFGLDGGSDGRVWGLAAQLYAVRSERNWGIGDFADLGTLAVGSAGKGARVLGLNPLHALFGREPRHVSPYSPSTRRFLNPLYLAIDAVPDLDDCTAARDRIAAPDFQARLQALRAAGFVDHAAVSAAKREVLELLYASFRSRHLGAEPDRPATPRGAAFRRFQRDAGADLRSFAVFEALHEQRTEGFSWRGWPAALRDPHSEAVHDFAAGHADRVEFFEYLQWEADRQLGDAARLGEAGGLSIGLYRDLAVGVDPQGAEAWGDQQLIMGGATLGAPPDLLNLKGQNWGLAAISPVALRERAYAPFIAALAANMRHAGAIRIDHVMALRQLYLIPQGALPGEGTYVHYPFEDLLHVVALESHRNRCVVVGEDLGTVPEGFRERLAEAGVLSYRLLVFERLGDGSFLPPQAYPPLAAASVGTHDVATFKGFWLGRDLEWRRELDLYPDQASAAAEHEDRRRQRHLLLDALAGQGVLPPELAAELLPSDDAPAYSVELVAAVHRFLGQSPARLMLVQLEDAAEELEQVNLPGTFEEHPNWRRKLSLGVDELLGERCLAQLADALNAVRPPPALQMRSADHE